MCGENLGVTPVSLEVRGSSPRVRGKLSRGFTDLGQRGLIPACAGKTWLAGKKRHEKGAHPRVCGENQAATTPALPTPGSSPRVRGKPNIRAEAARRGRLIPACAGKTTISAVFSGFDRAHPRVCGENRAWPQSFFTLHGSSPRVRGKREQAGILSAERGLIPACAGKTKNNV